MKRVLLKLSGEALAGEQKRGFDEATVTEEETSGEDVPAEPWTEARRIRSACLLLS